MAHKSKFRGAAPAQVPLRQRIDKARHEGRYQQALELARQLYKQDPTEAHLAVLRQVSLERGQQLESQKQLKEAATLYANAAEMGGPSEFQRQLVENLASCGAGAQALALAAKLGDSQLLGRAHEFLVDAALRQGVDGRGLLPADLQPQFDAILQAFQHAEAGRDEQARGALQLIGLQSPFLEWRVLLRGLLAYYANDDQRALENWQRLDARRLPARLAAPLRFQIDPAFRDAQPAAGQNHLRQQFERIQGAGLVTVLRGLQGMFGRDVRLAPAFRQVEKVLGILRRDAANLVPRLAACFRWAIIDWGDPEDLDRYLRVFGAPPEDPHLNRLHALAMAKRGMLVEAHQAWRDFEKDVAKNPAAWPGDQARHVRALILTHMGVMAVEAPDAENFDMLFSFGPKRKPRKLFKPSAEESFRRSLELAPEAQQTHEALFAYLVSKQETKKAIAAGKTLIERFPNNTPILQALAAFALVEENLDEAQDFLERALRVNPLERSVRTALAKVHEHKARQLALLKRFDEARAAAQTCLALMDVSKYVYVILAAAVELKAKNMSAYQEFVAKAEAEVGARLPVAYCLMCESIRLKMTPAQKKEFTQEFQTALMQNPEPALVARLARLAVLQRSAGPPYHGQKTHEKKIVAAVDKQPWPSYDEVALERLTYSLGVLESTRLFQRTCAEAQRRFPSNPRFFLAEASYLLDHQQHWRPWDSDRLLEHARSIIDALPRGENQQMLLGELQRLEEKHRAMSGPASMVGDMIDRFMEMGPFDDEDDDDDELF